MPESVTRGVEYYCWFNLLACIFNICGFPYFPECFLILTCDGVLMILGVGKVCVCVLKTLCLHSAPGVAS